MDINIGIGWIEKNGRKKVSRSMNIKSTFDGNWDSQEDHLAFRQKIYDLHPNKGIIGYCPSDELAPAK